MSLPVNMRIVHLLFVLGVSALFTSPQFVHAHPVPKDQHDRKINVHLTKSKSGILEITVHYRLEVDEYTMLVKDMQPFLDQVDVRKVEDKRNAFHKAYTRIFAPVLAANLIAAIDDKEFSFKCTKRNHTLVDEKGTPLGHLRCDFVFVGRSKNTDAKAKKFTFREGNYELEAGQIDLTLSVADEIRTLEIRKPSKTLREKPLTQLAPGEEEQLRQAIVFFYAPPPPPIEEKSNSPGNHSGNLVDLLQKYKHAVWLLLAFSLFFGAAHALTPGHGKTLMAAYLVGDRGTVLHALVLGLVTTLTHTGVVLIIAVLLRFISQEYIVPWLQGIQLGFGLAIVGIGFWLLTRRLSGRADHFHIGSGHHHHHHHGDAHHHHHAHDHSHHHHHGTDHHHHHGNEHSHDHHHDHADHTHDKHGAAVPLNESKPVVGLWALVVMGMQGGIVPCWDAVFLLFFAVASGLLAYALPMLLAFSAGLAGVLVLVGVTVVSAKKFAEGNWGESRIVKALPIISAGIVMALGIWLCFDAVHGGGH